MNLTRDEKQAMLYELLDSFRGKKREDYPPSITTAEYAEREGISRRSAYDRLEDAVLSGLMAKEKEVNVGGKSCAIYFIPEEQAPTE